MIPSLLLQADLLRRQEVRFALRRDAPELLLGAILTTAGILTIILFLARGRKTERVLLWFGLFTAAYGVRLTLQANLFQFAAEPVSHVTWRYLIATVTYLMPPLAALFLAELFPQWGRINAWLVRALGAWALIAIAADILLQRPASLEAINNALVIAGVAALMFAHYRQPVARQLAPLHAGVIALFSTVLINNISAFYIRDRPMLLIMLEPAGFVCFIIGLGTVVVRRLFRSEEQLIEVSKELQIARHIQNSILPDKPPASPDIRVATRYLPMTAVAGDFYDFLPVSEKQLGILIADVSGHGVPAALIASMVKLAIAAQLPHAQDPALVLAGMNQLLCGKMQGQFVSAAYLFLDCASGLMRYAGAGHPPLLVWRQDGVEAISENGLLLGLFPLAAYTSLERELKPGTRFLLYTDGIMEAGNAADEFFGQDRAVDVLRLSQTLNPEKAADLLLEHVSAWAGPRPQDDLTLLVIDVSAA